MKKVANVCQKLMEEPLKTPYVEILCSKPLREMQASLCDWGVLLSSEGKAGFENKVSLTWGPVPAACGFYF